MVGVGVAVALAVVVGVGVAMKTQGDGIAIDLDEGEIRHVIVFRNGNVAVCDAAGQQIPAVQGFLPELLADLSAMYSHCPPELGLMARIRDLEERLAALRAGRRELAWEWYERGQRHTYMEQGCGMIRDEFGPQWEDHGDVAKRDRGGGDCPYGEHRLRRLRSAARRSRF